MISPSIYSKTVTRHVTLFILCALSVLVPLSPKAEASDGPGVPWECSSYSGEVQSRCIGGMLEEQRNQIGQLERQLQTQQSQLRALQDQAARPPQVTTPPAAAPPPPLPYAFTYGSPYGYPYGYGYYPPGIGLGFSFGGPYAYGGYGHRFGGHGHWGHGHHR